MGCHISIEPGAENFGQAMERALRADAVVVERYGAPRVLDEAAAAGKLVILHVARSNRARALYQRLGFAISTRDDVYLEMQWRPGGDAAIQSAP